MEFQKMDDETDYHISDKPVKREVVWQNVLIFIYLHMSALYGLSLLFLHAQFSTIVFSKYSVKLFFAFFYFENNWIPKTMKYKPNLRNSKEWKLIFSVIKYWVLELDD